MPLKYWVVIGRDRTRKSSTIYSLTGTSRQRMRWELTVGDDFQLAYIDPRSAQERPEVGTPKLLLVQIEFALRSEPNLSHAILAFHHNRKGWPSAVEYLDELKAKGHTCVGALFTQTNQKTMEWFNVNHPDIKILMVDEGNLPPSNKIANYARAEWGL